MEPDGLKGSEGNGAREDEYGKKKKVPGRRKSSAAVTIPQICLSLISEQSDTREKNIKECQRTNAELYTNRCLATLTGTAL